MSHVPKIPQREPSGIGDAQAAPSSGWRADAAQGRRPIQQREPALLIPAPVVAIVLLIAGIQALRGGLTLDQDLSVLGWFAFVPARYADAFGLWPGGLGADAWTFVTYALLHGSWLHVISNSVWLVAFGSAVARRFGAVRFVLFFAVCAAAGAAAHLALHFGEAVPVVGASAAIAGLMAAAARFVFDGGRLVVGAGNDNAAFRRPARPLLAALTNRSVMFFVLMFFGINLVTGVGSAASGGMAIAWEAHLGGFLAGLLLFRLFDPVPRA